ncbi:hydrolase 1, exosortase A system-associated [Massilia sp. Se16.2.3]|uniref:hydrolase 1, exosortase A system-associated n=1 Tax=Massilia sp. Se16.2.3 TaxID=2709303 RepID=UPI001E5BC7A5|nr:hydrolase 1, exosortase A system-associated [Massilia sp. Se16.2.3]
MKLEQRALRFPSGGNALIGIVDVPERPLARGMLLLHDSLQYRAGSHRQFTLLSRLLAARGVAVMRFDRGASGDSAGGADAGALEERADVSAAMKEFFTHVPEMKESVIPATGDAAACALGYAASDARITGLALLEPEWDAASPGAAPASKPPYSAADRLFRRAAAFRHAATRARAPAEPAPPAASVLDGALRDYEGQVLVVGSSRAGRRAGACPHPPCRTDGQRAAPAPQRLARRRRLCLRKLADVLVARHPAHAG